MRTLARFVVCGALLLALAAAAVLALGLEDAPRVTRPAAIQAGDMAAAGLRGARALFGGPGSAAGTARSLLLSQREAEWLLDRAANRRLPSATRVELRPGTAVVRTSLALPANPFGRWLNAEATLRDGAPLPAVEAWRVGRLPLPAWLGQWALHRLADRFGAGTGTGAGDSELGAAVRLARDMVRGVAFDSGVVRVSYDWHGDARERLTAALLPAAEQARARAYHDRLAELAAAARPAGTVSLAALLPPLFALAQQRTAAGGEAALENRAAILTLALHATGRGWPQLVPAAGAWRDMPPLVPTLAGRDDFPQHWLVSAAIAIEGGGPLADAIGLHKELEDKRGGSGFSFNDLAADRAGARFGLLAVAEPAAVQARLAAGASEADLMPGVADLPEFMSEAEFRRRYGGVGSPAYERMLAVIEARVAALPVLRRP